ncbi:hypothetical protein BV22DRAFT_1025851 [Leucogyrophana mollusca]|uniref:Uncharacterized protein n=1 Tax=Leucogyrophana mollusca TaxID=85980 RepID=A0ACB8AWS4_9AGAM|nr:hypothetical protein BV22DRAFT_1025851 [Leucogyrophana mollusca]
MSNQGLKVQLIGGDHDGCIAFIPRITSTPSGNTAELSFQVKHRQFPVRLAFAFTINKSQDQSARYVGINLRAPIFAHGQLYIALSRATSSSQIKVLLGADSTRNTTPNVVYPKVLVD